MIKEKQEEQGEEGGGKYKEKIKTHGTKAASGIASRVHRTHRWWWWWIWREIAHSGIRRRGKPPRASFEIRVVLFMLRALLF